MNDTTGLTPGAHRAIRMLDAQDSAYAGELITDGERRGVRVDADTIIEDLWVFAGAEHVAGVRDVMRRPDGHDAVLPWCADRLEVFLGRRAAAESPLSAGETVTLVGSLLRGIAEVGDRDVTGRWWLTDDARPVFAPGDGAGCADSAVALLARLREGCADRAMSRLLGEIAQGADDQRVVRRAIDRWERELTELAAPRPLGREVFAPERVVTIEAHTARLPEDREALAVGPGALHGPRDRLREVGGRVTRWGRSRIGRRWRAPAAGRTGTDTGARVPRGRIAVVGGAAAALVLLGGLVWPAPGEDSAATARAGGPAPVSAPSSTQDATPDPRTPSTDSPSAAQDEGAVPTPDAVVDGSAEQHAAALLAIVLDCARNGDTVCADAVVDGAGELVQERLMGTDANRTISAVEDYGDVSVLRLGASGDRGEQMLVLIMRKDGWLVRDVYDVADQPSGQG